MANKYITKKSENLSEWYNSVILKAELADYAPVKGCMVIRPYGYALWEAIQKFMDPLIKEHGVKNAYFPLFIPERFINKEKEHVEGFAPEMAVVTQAGGEELKEKLIVRPTSETIMYEMYKQWTQSYRDLPILINQWNNVVRWEKRTYLFLRTSEFLWQEGHCAHLTAEENMETVLWAMDMYKKTFNELMGIYGIVGWKSETEKFAGAGKTLTFEALMPDGKSLQSCTSHDLSQNFSKSFDWTVLDDKAGKTYPYQNSWGFSTRSIGGLILVHGDDDGLVLPPKIAPTKLVIIPILGKMDEEVLSLSQKIKKLIQESETKFSGGVEIWGDEGKFATKTFGWKAGQSELLGIPLVITVGPKEVEGNGVVVHFRKNKNFTSGEINEDFKNIEVNFDRDDLPDIVENMLEHMQSKLLENHKKFTEEHTFIVDDYVRFKEIMSTDKGFLSAFWCENADCEAKIKAETKATTRCLPINAKEENGKCIYCGNASKHRWLFGQSY